MSAIGPIGPEFINEAGIRFGVRWLFLSVALVAAMTDYRSGKIYNWLTVPALVGAFLLSVLSAWLSGLSAFGSGLAGCGLVAAIFIPLFYFRVIGGGDVKLLLALALALRWQGTLDLIYGTFCIAGLGALAILVKHRRIMVFMRECALFMRSLMVAQLEVHWPRLSRDYKAPFGVAILFGYIFAMVRLGAA